MPDGFDHDLLIRIDEQVKGIRQDLKDHTRACEQDNLVRDKRMGAVERFQMKLAGGLMLGTVVFAVLARFVMQ